MANGARRCIGRRPRVRAEGSPFFHYTAEDVLAALTLFAPDDFGPGWWRVRFIEGLQRLDALGFDFEDYVVAQTMAEAVRIAECEKSAGDGGTGMNLAS